MSMRAVQEIRLPKPRSGASWAVAQDRALALRVEPPSASRSAFGRLTIPRAPTPTALANSQASAALRATRQPQPAARGLWPRASAAVVLSPPLCPSPLRGPYRAAGPAQGFATPVLARSRLRRAAACARPLRRPGCAARMSHGDRLSGGDRTETGSDAGTSKQPRTAPGLADETTTPRKSQGIKCAPPRHLLEFTASSLFMASVFFS